MNPQEYTTITNTEFRKLYRVNFNAETKEDGLLGKGGYGAVYKGWDIKDTKEVAIKRSETDKGLLKEVVLGRVVPKNGNIAKYLEGYRVHSKESVDFDVAILQYYPEGNLDDLFFSEENKTLPTVEQTDTILIGILKGLKFLHEGFSNSEGKHVSIVHRDLKPHNILIAQHEKEYIPLITDFGISKAIVRDDIQKNFERLSSGKGTGAYKSPEQIQGIGAEFNHNLDLWAFGVMLFKILTRRLPFYSNLSSDTGAYVNDIFSKIVNSDLEEVYRQVADQPEKYQKVIRRCLVRNIKERAQSAGELIDILGEIPEKLVEAKRLFKGKDYEEAKEKFEQLLKLRSDHEEANQLLSECESFIQQEIEIEESLHKAQVFMKRQNYEEAKSFFVWVLSKDKDRNEAKEGLERCKFFIQQEIEIKEELRKAQALMKQQSYGAAMVIYSAVLIKDEARQEARDGLKRCKELIDQENERIEWERKKKIEELTQLANDFFSKKIYTQARGLYEQILSIEKDNAGALDGVKKCVAKIREAESGTDPNEVVKVVVKPIMRPDGPTDEAVVVIPPTIKNFSISPNRIKQGDQVTVSWQVGGDSEKVALRSPKLDLDRWVAKSDSITMTIREEAELVLEVFYQGGSVVQRNRVEVVVPVVVPKKPINKLLYLIPVLVALFFVGIVVIPRLTGPSAKEIANKRRTDDLKADSLFSVGERELAAGIDKDIVSETYFKKAVELKPALAGRAYDIFSNLAAALKEAPEVSENYQRLANEYLDGKSSATTSK